MRQSAVSAKVLIDVSELRLDTLRWAGEDDERSIVRRLYESNGSYRRWQSFHGGLMRHVSGSHSRQGQIALIRRTSFELIHRQALFEYLRENDLSEAGRKAVMAGFHGTLDFSRALVAEHGRYLQSNSSLFCARYLGRSVLWDARFSGGLDDYRLVYMDFFSHYCSWIQAESRGDRYPGRYLLPPLKRKLNILQADLLSLPLPVAERRRKRRAPRQKPRLQ